MADLSVGLFVASFVIIVFCCCCFVFLGVKYHILRLAASENVDYFTLIQLDSSPNPLLNIQSPEYLLWT